MAGPAVKQYRDTACLRDWRRGSDVPGRGAQSPIMEHGGGGGGGECHSREGGTIRIAGAWRDHVHMIMVMLVNTLR